MVTGTVVACTRVVIGHLSVVRDGPAVALRARRDHGTTVSGAPTRVPREGRWRPVHHAVLRGRLTLSVDEVSLA